MISRRHLLAALAAIPALPLHIFGQDAPAGRGQQRDTTPHLRQVGPSRGTRPFTCASGETAAPDRTGRKPTRWQ